METPPFLLYHPTLSSPRHECSKLFAFPTIPHRALTLASLSLVTGLLEVVCEGGDNRGGVSSDLGLAVDANDDAGLGGRNGNTLTALGICN